MADVRDFTMEPGGGSEGAPQGGLRALLGAVRRRLWVFVLLLFALPGATAALTLRQHAEYQASADVLVSQGDLASMLSGLPAGSGNPQDEERRLATQAALAHVPTIAQRTLSNLPGAHISVEQFLKNSSVAPQPNSNILRMTVQDGSPSRAIKLAHAYAHAYVDAAGQDSKAQIETALARIGRRLRRIRAERAQAPSTLRPELDQQYSALVTQQTQLDAFRSVPSSNLSVVREPRSAEQVAPRPLRNIILAVALAIVVGMAYVLLSNALNTRLFSTDELQKTLGLPLIARLPRPLAARGKGSAVKRLHSPSGHLAEAFATVRVGLAVNPRWPATRVLMVASAIEAEGKSSCALGLSLSLARTGMRVALVDADLRRPSLHSYTSLSRQPGLTDVLSGRLLVEEALQTVPLHSSSDNGAGPAEDPREIGSEDAGQLALLAAGTAVLTPQDVLGLPAMPALLGELTASYDIVIIDTAPLLAVGDTMALDPVVDAIIAVSAVNKLRRTEAKEFSRLLRRCNSEKLGLVTTGAAEGDTGEGRYLGSYGGYRPRAPA